MLDSINKTDVATRIHATLRTLSEEPKHSVHGTDAMKMMMLLAGMTVETAFLFDSCEESLEGTFDKLAKLLDCEPYDGPVNNHVLPPSTIMDFDTEQGRAVAREFFEEWLDCAYEFHEMLLFLIHQIFMSWEAKGQDRAESFRLFIECTHKAMAFELAAQELCDALIEQKIGAENWSLGDGISALAGSAGWYLAQSQEGINQCCWFRADELPDLLDQTTYVMTQEAARLGIDTVSDWRFGLAANDIPLNPPMDLVNGLEAITHSFFHTISMKNYQDQAVCCAKAAGRIVAVAAGGKRPSIEPVIAKPLAMAAITECYKSYCVRYAVSSAP